uniref:Uncharacterized protein n=1 Tax=Opuntia streptacantha TaxID=393608 RepID=A0A7C9CN17_OPUST
MILSNITPTAPSRTALPRFSTTTHRLNIADAASFMANGCPSSRRSIKGLRAPNLPIRCLLESRADNVNRAAAALVLVSIRPHFKDSMSRGTTAGCSAISFLLLSCIERFNTAVMRSS